MRNVLAIYLLLLCAVSAARAQCPVPTQPVVLSVISPGTQFTGSTQLAADNGLLATDYISAMTPLVQIHRLTAAGWALDTTIDAPSGVRALAIRGEFLVIRTGSASTLRLNILAHQPISNTWNPVAGILQSDPSDSSFGQGLTFDSSSDTFAFRSSGSPDRVLIYQVLPDSTVAPMQAIEDPEPAPNHTFGFDITIDGELLAVSAVGDSAAGPHAGAVYIFRRIDDVWTLIQKILPPPTLSSDHFGQSVAMHAGHLVVGAVHSSGIPGDSGGLVFSGGFARVYEFNGESFDLQAHLQHPTSPGAASAFGHDVAIRNDRLLVAAFQDDLTGIHAGAAFVFDLVDGSWQSNCAYGVSNAPNGWLGSSVAMTADHAFAVAPLLRGGAVAAVVFDRCALHAIPPPIIACSPGISGLFQFLGLYFHGDPAADYNRDGVVGSLDLVAYLDDWFAGCP